ncbi:MAG: hypothetical protein H6707_08955 [Deltaproteobacteria bacterium]|nr:hypothetical protein [Deltaproteobacteria bacterium]
MSVALRRLLAGLALVVNVAPSGAARARSVVYPAIVGLRFDHERHRKVDCMRCHAGVERSTSAAARHLPREQVCRKCHASQTRKDDSPSARKAAGGCSYCHQQTDAKRLPPALRAVQATLHFSHRLHGARAIDCASCHGAGGEMPTKRTCLGCHAQRGATKRCSACHPQRADGRLKLELGGGRRLVPRSATYGDAHQLGFGSSHAQIARTRPGQCDRCHRPQDCQACHAATLRPMSIHAGDYIAKHALDARHNRPNCASCHRHQTFCLSCHRRSKVANASEDSRFRPNGPRDFHPPGWSSSLVGAEHHRFRARRALRSCTSCHREADCVRCHQAAKLGGGGFSPHGENFARTLRCASLRRRNARVCAKCHSPIPSCR